MDGAARAEARVGTVLRGKYHLDRVLGIGGMAVVYSATHRNRKQFAVKVLHQELSLHSDPRTRFLREGYVANTVDHPGAVAVLDDDIAEDGAAFLVMELLDGETVEQLWERSGHRLSLEAVLTIGDQILNVLAAAHTKGIVHRDIKPANVFLTRAGQLKILDFGIARLRDVAASHATNSGLLLGTPAFMAPEQALADPAAIDSRTDLWAVGATMFTLATGRLVHEGDNAVQVLVKAAHAPAQSLSTILPEVPPEAAHVIDCALAFDKAARWPSAEAMRAAIDVARQKPGVRGPRSSAPDANALLALAFAPTASSEPESPQYLRDFDDTKISPHVDPTGDTKVVALDRRPGDDSEDSTIPRGPRQGAGVIRETEHAQPVVQGSVLETLTTFTPIHRPGFRTSNPVTPTRGRARRSNAYLFIWIGGGTLIALTLVISLMIAATRKTSVAPAATREAATLVQSTEKANVSASAEILAGPLDPESVRTTPITSVPRIPTASGIAAAPRATSKPTPAHATSGGTETSPPAPNPLPTASCDPPYDVDATGNKHWKLECLKK